MTKKIFLSYSMKDENKIASIVKTLRQHESVSGKDLTVVNPLGPSIHSEDVRKRIKRSIEEADAVVVVWTPTSATSSWVNYEAGMADALGKQIIVVRPDKTAPALPANLQSVQVVDLKGKLTKG
jgi:nucleoside 2-deoxyribosyltransferase